MRFNPRARLDSSRIGSSSRGRRGGGLPIPGGIRAGGGIAGIVVALLVYLLSTQLGGGGGTGGAGGGLDPSRLGGASLTGGSAGGFDYGTCRTGADANASEECALVAVENSLTDYWAEQPDLAGGFSPPQQVHVFGGSVQTGGCGGATSATGPFYCPADRTIYLDPSFYDTIYTRLGGRDTLFVRSYVLAHEYGHHVQNLRGTMGEVISQQGPESDAVRLELQADCFAGMWTGAAEGDGFIQDLTEQDIAEGIEAATVVGDDHIQRQAGGRVDVSQYTHGSSAQRVAWFTAGMSAGSVDRCDTFAAQDLDRP